MARVGGAFVCFGVAALMIGAHGLPDRAAVMALVPPQAGSAPVAAEIGGAAPQIEAADLADLSGVRLSLAALRGSPVVINFWATWCGPCAAEAPLLEAAFRTARGDPRRADLHIIGLDSDEGESSVLAWKARFGTTFTLALDYGGQAAALYRVRGLPATFFIGRDGVIRAVVYGALTPESLSDGLARISP